MTTVLRILQNLGSGIKDYAQLVLFIERLELDHYLGRIGDRDTFASGLLADAWRAMRR